MRVLVCGGRDYADRETLFTVLDELLTIHGFTLLIHGGARGADRIAGEWAYHRRIKQERYEAEWDRLGRKAGAVRNARMLSEGRPQLVVAFPGGRGTADMVARARAAGVDVHMVKV